MSSKSWTGIWANKQIKYSILICCRHSFNRHEFNGSRSSTPIRFRFGFWFDVVKCKCSFNCNDMNEILLCISSNSHKFHKSKCFSMTIIHSTHTHAHAQPKDTHLIQGYECFALQSYQIQRTHTHNVQATDLTYYFRAALNPCTMCIRHGIPIFKTFPTTKFISSTNYLLCKKRVRARIITAIFDTFILSSQLRRFIWTIQMISQANGEKGAN